MSKKRDGFLRVVDERDETGERLYAVMSKTPGPERPAWMSDRRLLPKTPPKRRADRDADKT